MSPLGVGAQLGQYRIEEFIGRGGMGIVYRAHHEHLGRDVALKLLAPELAENPSFRDRFVRESRLAASIDHPNVIPIYEAGDVDGNYFIAMRYVDGVDLREVLQKEGPLQLERALTILTQVAGALDAAHAKGLVHRDVKPGNILVARGSEHCYLTDFGLTKAISSDTAFTATGQFVGTTDYVAPEQIEGRELDRRTDVYALGCVFFECLTGGTPFKRDTDMAVMWAHIQEPAPRVSVRRGDLPAELDDVVATAMAKAKDDRYPSCSTFAAAARSALEVGTGRSFVGAPVPPSPAAPLPPTRARTPITEQIPPSGPHYPPPAPAASSYPPPPQQQYPGDHYPYPPPAGRQKPLTAIALIVAALLLAGGGTAAALIITGKDDEKPVASAPKPDTGTATAESTTPESTTPESTTPESTTPEASTPSTPPPAQSAGEKAEQSVRDYWNLLADEKYSAAYAHWDPSNPPQGLGPESWAAARQKDGLYNVEFNTVDATDVGGGRATVQVDFVTMQSSCIDQHWSGYYIVIRKNGRWLINDHELNKPPCE